MVRHHVGTGLGNDLLIVIKLIVDDSRLGFKNGDDDMSRK